MLNNLMKHCAELMLAMVCSAAIIYCVWFHKPTRPERVIFENDQLIIYGEYNALTNQHEIKTVNK